MMNLNMMCLNLMTSALLLIVLLLLLLSLLLSPELKPLPDPLKYSFLGPDESLSVIITSDLNLGLEEKSDCLI